LFFIPSSNCYNAGEEFIEKVLEVLMESIEKQLHNYHQMLNLYLSYCSISGNMNIDGQVRLENMLTIPFSNTSDTTSKTSFYSTTTTTMTFFETRLTATSIKPRITTTPIITETNPTKSKNIVTKLTPTTTKTILLMVPTTSTVVTTRVTTATLNENIRSTTAKKNQINHDNTNNYRKNMTSRLHSTYKFKHDNDNYENYIDAFLN
jgi:hypothetical protein